MRIQHVICFKGHIYKQCDYYHRKKDGLGVRYEIQWNLQRGTRVQSTWDGGGGGLLPQTLPPPPHNCLVPVYYLQTPLTRCGGTSL